MYLVFTESVWSKKVQKQPPKGLKEPMDEDGSGGTYHVLLRGNSPTVLPDAVIL